MTWRTLGRGASARQPREVTIDVAAVPDEDDEDQEPLVPDLIDDTVVSYPNAIQVVTASDLLAALRTWIGREVIDTPRDPRLHCLGQRRKLPYCLRCEVDRVLCAEQALIVESELNPQALPGDRAVSFGFFQRGAHGFQVDPILQCLEQFSILHRDDGSDRLPPTCERDALLSVGGAVDDLCVLVAPLNRCYRLHVSPPFLSEPDQMYSTDIAA